MEERARLGAEGSGLMEDSGTPTNVAPPVRGAWSEARRLNQLAPRHALCCVCGTVRLTCLNGGRVVGEVDGTDGESPAAGRCMIIRKCATCGSKTQHAYLTTDLTVDRLEKCRPYPSLDDDTERDLLELEVAELRAAGVEITDDESDRNAGMSAIVMQTLDDSMWHVVLCRSVPPRGLRDALRTVRRVMAEPNKCLGWTVEPASGGRPPMRASAVRL